MSKSNESGYMPISNDRAIRTQAGDQKIIKGIKHNLSADAAPTVNDDFADGYQAGSLWIINQAGDATDGDIYICSDGAEGAAAWEQIHDDTP